MRMALFLAAALLTLGGACAQKPEASPAPPLPEQPHMAAFGTTPQVTDRFTLLSGTAGTAVVPAGDFVTSIWAHNTTGGGTVTIAPVGLNSVGPCDASTDGANPDGGPALCQQPSSTITIPAGSAWGVSIPALRGGWDELADGTQFVFTGTDSYVVTLYHYATP